MHLQSGSAATGFGLLPKPLSVQPMPGEFVVDGGVRIAALPDLSTEAAYLSDFLRRGGVRTYPQPLPRGKGVDAGVVATATDELTGLIELILDPGEEIVDEGYRLEVKPGSVHITASSAAGIFWGVQSFLQLCGPAIYVDGGIQSPLSIPCVTIDDKPRFGWRGLMLDVARHFMPLDFVKKFIDLLAMHKMNRLHLHLVDDQGWRVEIKKYPKLTSVGAFRDKTIAGHLEQFWKDGAYDHTPHGGFYTQDELRDLVAYAADRHIEIVPEIEMPGHAQAAIAAYPELGNVDHPVDVCPAWGIIEHIFNPAESTIAFLQDVLTEVMEIFPSTFIHIGGDEAVKNEWKASPLVQERIRELGLKDEDELQSWFIRRMDDFLTSKGRRLIGWDEIIEGGLAKNATVMSWRGEHGGIEAAVAGHDVVMAPTTYTYLDHYQSRDRSTEPLAQGGYMPLDVVYGYDPIPAEMPAAAAHHVLGAQGQLWSEYLPTPERVEYMAFPRACALAEAVWSTPERDYDEFLSRLRVHLTRLDAKDVKYRILDK